MGVKDVYKGVAEGVSRAASEKATEMATSAIKSGSDTITTRFFGLGPGDEAKFTLALGAIKDEEDRKKIADFMQTLSKGERNWFGQVIAKMETKHGKAVLEQLAMLPDDQARRERAEATGLLKGKSSLSETATTLTGGLRRASSKIREKYERREDK